MRKLPLRLFNALIATALLGIAGAASAEVAVTVDAGTRHQTIVGWEAVPRMWEYDKINNRFDGSWMPMSDKIFDALVNDVGINRLRLELRSGSENPVDYWGQFERGEISYKEMKNHFYHRINDNSDPMVAAPGGFQFSFLDFQVEHIVLPIKKRLEARGEKLYLNLNVVDFKGGEGLSNFSLANSPRDYGELISQAFQHLETRWGLRPDALEIVLEPENTVGWDGKAVGAAAVNAINRLEATGPVPDIILPSNLNAKNAVPFFTQALSVPGLRKYASAISFHLYRGNGDSVIRDIAATAEKYGVRAEMLEYTKGTDAELFRDLTVGNVTAWNLFSIIGPRDPESTQPGLSVLLYGDAATGRVGLSHQGRVLAPVFHAVRRGAVRIDAISDADAVGTAAFVNPDGGMVVALRVPDQKPEDVALSGLAEGRYMLTLANWLVPEPVVTELAVPATGTLNFTVPGHNVAVLSQVMQ
jgi:hypothetical protein